MAVKINKGAKVDITKQPLSEMEDAENHIQFLQTESDFAERQH